MDQLQTTEPRRGMLRRHPGRPRIMLVAFAAALLLAGILAGTALATLNPPQPYVLDADGVTKHNLVDAGILKGASTGGKTGTQWAIVLGKALFWDHQAGSDGNACASCHFHAGADTRLRNQITPGFNDVTKGPDGDSAFGSERSDTGAVSPGNMPSGAKADSNYLLKSADMPLHRLQDETDRNSPIITTTNDRISSQGAFDGDFTRVKILGQRDKCTSADPSIFHAGPYAARQVEPRNTPTFHNAGFFFRNFWDGRANNLFNGVGVFGMRDVEGGDPGNLADPRHNNRLIILENGVPKLGSLKVEDFSLASQAVGPPISALEMSCDGRSFADVGRKLLFTVPLLQQTISKQDSVLGPYVSASGKGLKLQYIYATLIMRAFDPKYWAAPGRFRIKNGALVKDPAGYTQMEINFSMFWGVSIGLFELTQVADRSEFDDLQAAGRLAMKPGFGGPPFFGATGCSTPTGDVDELLVRGCTIFSRFQPVPPDSTSSLTALRGGNCFVCHNQGGGNPIPGSPLPTAQPLLAEGATQNGQFFLMFLTVADANPPPPGINNDLRDQGFASIGLRPAFSDRMSGNTDPYGNPLSFGRQLWSYLKGNPNALLDPALQRRIATGTDVVNGATKIAILPFPASGAGNISKLEVDGSAKAPILRNVALTPPYFSWGGYPSLRQALKVYNRGGNRRDITSAGSLDAHGSACSSGDDSGSGPDGNHPWPVADADCNTNTTGVIIPLGLSDCEAPVGTFPRSACDARGQTVDTDDLAALVRFLKSLTDPRVQCDMAPFDHPSLTILNGHKVADANHDGKADDITSTLPAVGAAGYAHTSSYCVPNSGDLFAPGMQSRSGGAKATIP